MKMQQLLNNSPRRSLCYRLPASGRLNWRYTS